MFSAGPTEARSTRHQLGSGVEIIEEHVQERALPSSLLWACIERGGRAISKDLLAGR